MADLPKGYVLDPTPDIGNVKVPDGYKLDPYQDPITAAGNKVAPFAGRAITEALPAIGSFAGAGGTLIGTGISQAMKRARPDLFGEQPQGADAVLNAGKELLLNNVLPAGLGKLGKLAIQTDMTGIAPQIAQRLSNFPAVREGVVKQLTEQVNKRLYPESQVIEQGATNAGDRLNNMQDEISNLRADHPDIPPSNSLQIDADGIPRLMQDPGGPHPLVKAAMDHLSDVYGRNKVGGMLIRMQREAATMGGDIARTQTYKEISNTTLGDLIHVQNAKITAGPEFTNDLAVNRVLTGAGNPTDGTIDAAKALSELGGKNGEIYTEAMNPASKTSLTNVLTLMQQQEKTNTTDMVINYSKRRLMWNIGGGMLLGELSHPLTGLMAGAAAESPVITDWALRKIMANPETAKLVTAAMQTPAKSPQGTLINKALTEILPRVIQGEADVAATPNH